MKLPLLVGARLVLTDGLEMICYPQTRAAYGELSTLLSEGKLKAEKGECHLTLDDVLARSEDQIFIAFPPAEGTSTAFEETLTRLGGLWPGRVFLAARFTFGGRNRERIARLAELGARCGAPIVATNDRSTRRRRGAVCPMPKTARSTKLKKRAMSPIWKRITTNERNWRFSKPA